MKVPLNLATAPLENNRRLIAGAGLLGILGVAALLLLSRAAYRNWEANRELRSAIGRSEDRIRSSQRRQQELASYFKNPEAQRVMDRAGFLNSLIDQRSFPWTKIFMDLEEVLPAGVRVVSIAPEMKNGRVQVKLVVGAASDESKLKFLQALEKSKVFQDVQVTQETRPNQAASPDQVQLDLVAWYSTT